MARSTKQSVTNVTPYTRAHAWEDAFLEVYAQAANMSDAARQVGIDPSTPRQAKRRSARFREQLAEMDERVNDRVRREIYTRGVAGWDEPVFGTVRDEQGQTHTAQVGTIRRKSDRMLELYAKARMPDEFGDRVKVDYVAKVKLFAEKFGLSEEETRTAERLAEEVAQAQRATLRRVV